MSNINDPQAEKFIAILNLSDTLQYFLDAHEEINGCIDPCECDGCKAARFHLERIGRSDAPKNNAEQSEDAALPDGRWIPVSERLPDFDVNVLWCYQDGGMFVDMIDHDSDWDTFRQPHEDHPFGLVDPIKYWQELPTPPTN